MPTADGPWETANILADGPSVLHVREQHLLPGPTIAVNCALKMEPFVPVDVWAVVDAPDLLWDVMQGHFQDHMDLLTTGNNMLAWESRLPVKRILAVEPIYLAKDGVQEVDDRGRKILMPTITFTLAYLFKYRKTEHVRVFGADMKGENGPLHPFLPFLEEDTPLSRMRWVAERIAFAQAMRLYRADGRRLERHFVDPPLIAA